MKYTYVYIDFYTAQYVQIKNLDNLKMIIIITISFTKRGSSSIVISVEYVHNSSIEKKKNKEGQN